MRKRAKRWPCAQSVTVQSGSQTVEAWVDDISAGGMRITARCFEATRGTLVVVSFRGMKAQGKVCWRNKAVIGLQFDRVLPQAMLSAMTSGTWRHHGVDGVPLRAR